MATVLPYHPSNIAYSPSAPTKAGDRTPSQSSFPSSKRAASAQSQIYRDGLPFHTASALPPSASLKRKRQIRPQYPASSTERHVEYILVASFDVDRGSIVEHQYPAPIGGDEHMLAELMLPDQAHVRSEDWTIFFLHKDTAAHQLPETNDARRRRTRTTEKGLHDTADDHASDDVGPDDSEEDEDMASIEGPPLVYVLNLVNTKQDNTVKRGAVVKAMAICTRHSFLHIYKPLLLLALEEYFRCPFPETLAGLYHAVNAMDVSLLPRLSFLERCILQASDAKELFVEKFEAMIQQRMADDRESNEDDHALQRYSLPRDTHELESIVKYNNIPVPVKIPTAAFGEIVGDFSLVKLVQIFSTPHIASPQPFATTHPHLTTSGPLTHPIIVLMNALLSQKRIIFIGHNLPSSNVAEAVLAACALASGGILRGFVRHAFPYTDLTKIDNLLNVPGFIAGVTNPRFANKAEWWDLLCDLQTGRMTISNKIEPVSATEGVLFFQDSGTHRSASGMSNAEQKSISAIATAGARLSAGLAGPVSVGTNTGDATGDNAFMASVLVAIAERRGESAVRAMFRLWILKFTRLAAALEEAVYGASALLVHSPTTVSPSSAVIMDASFPYDSAGMKRRGTDVSATSLPTTNGVTGDPGPAVLAHGFVFTSSNAKIQDLAANAARIEGWMKTRSYYNFVSDLVVLYKHRPVKDLDLQCLHDRLSKLRLGAGEAAHVYLAICAACASYQSICQLLVVVLNSSTGTPTQGPAGASVTPAASGQGLFYLALGLFHPTVDVREAVADLLARIRAHEAGRHFWDQMGRFEKAACERVFLARREREER